MQYDLRVGKIIEVEELKDIQYTTHKLVIDFGIEIGKKVSCASLVRYSKDQLLNKLVIGIVNLPPKQIGNILSEIVILGTPNEKNECILLIPDSEGAIIGAKAY